MERARLYKLASELLERIRHDDNAPSHNASVWVDEDKEEICIAPARNETEGSSYKNRVWDVKEVALFAFYNDLTLTTREYPTGAGLSLYE